MFKNVHFRCGSKQGEEDYRPLFENFVHDLLSTVNKPEWPAAELLLSLLGRLLVSSIIRWSSVQQKKLLKFVFIHFPLFCAPGASVQQQADRNGTQGGIAWLPWYSCFSPEKRCCHKQNGSKGHWPHPERGRQSQYRCTPTEVLNCPCNTQHFCLFIDSWQWWDTATPKGFARLLGYEHWDWSSTCGECWIFIYSIMERVINITCTPCTAVSCSS